MGDEPVEDTDTEFHLAHASRLEVIARSKKETDKIDAELMARMLLAGEIAPIKRFPTAKHLVSFAGLAPTIRQSGQGDPYHGRIPKGANRWVRGALVSAIPSHMNATPDSSLGQYYQQQKERVGWRTARVAVARKLCRAIRAMLRSRELWRG